MDTENNVPRAIPERNEKGQFVLGGKGIGGRTKGSRNQLGEAFIDDLYANWKQHGVETIEAARVADPAAYLKVVASILPRDLNVSVRVVEDMNDDELGSVIKQLLRDPDVVGFGETEIVGGCVN